MQLMEAHAAAAGRAAGLLVGVALALGLSGCGDDSGGGEGGGKPTSCTTDADCNDDDPCTSETCVEGRCQFEVAPDGDAALESQTPGDCAKIVCDGGRADVERDEGDIDDDHEPCTLDLCEDGDPVHLVQLDQIRCQVGVGQGQCVDGTCIVPCAGIDGDLVCDDLRPCTEDACLAGTCAHQPLDGDAPLQNEGDCKRIVCTDGEDVAEPDDADAPETGNACLLYVCSSGELADEYVAEGQPAPIDPYPGDCRNVVCDGNGSGRDAASAGDVPDDDNACTVDACVDGYPSFAAEPAETPCGGGSVCDGYGTCCIPITCDDVDVECGPVPDGCNGSIDCGGCDGPEWCGGGGSSNSCGCAPFGQGGPLYAAVAINDDTIGDVPWQSPQSILIADGAYATVEDLGSGDRTNWLRASGFGADIPESATITGIEVIWSRSGESFIVDRGVRLAKGGAFVGTDKATGEPWNGSGYGYYGGSEDLWGTTWTPADVADAQFGVALSIGNEGGSAGSAYVDTVWVTVYFTVTCD